MGDRGAKSSGAPGAARVLLGPSGPLARALAGYEPREGQLAMADAVERALAEDGVLLCEAGTGTGKTLAYLVPAVASGRTVVVSTATKALQEQIVHKDLPLLERHLGLDPRAMLVKGLGNYLCLRRFHELRAGPQAEAARSLPVLEAWARRTEKGDAAELSELREGDPLFRDVASSSDTRIGGTCAYYDECFVTRMKREAASARLLVVNHHLFFADLALKHATGRRLPSGAGALPPYDAVIFDEAHRIESVATQFLGTRVSRARIEALLRDTERSLRAAGQGEDTPAGAAARGLSSAVRAEADRLFFLLWSSAPPETRGGARASAPPARDDGSAAGEPDDAAGRLPLPRWCWSGDLLRAYHALDDALEALEAFASTHAISEAVRLAGARAAAVRDDFASIVDPATHHVTWHEARARGGAVGASPIDVGPLLRRAVFDHVGAAVLTSATLSTGSPPSFRFVRSRMGLSEAGAYPVEELCVASPFAFEERAILYVPRDLPEAGDASFVPEAAARIAELLALTGGGAFVLCTSTRSMRALAAALAGGAGGPLLVQGEAPKAALLDRFRASGHAVLVATMSFWEGVDVPGDALRLVVIEKIPFAVPTDPVVAARCASLEQDGQPAFSRYYVPQAALTLKQGFGRLIRTARDRGIVALLDRRARTKSYGAALLAGLPPAPRTDNLAEVAAFWERGRALTPG